MKLVAFVAVSLLLAAASGALVAKTLAQGTATPTQTVTVSVQNGEQGPPGPPGPTGPPGATTCDSGSTLSDLVINAPSGHVTLTGVCIKN